MVCSDKCLIKLADMLFFFYFFHLDDPARSSPDLGEGLVPRIRIIYYIFKQRQVNM